MRLFGKQKEAKRITYRFLGIPVIQNRTDEHFVRIYLLGIRVCKVMLPTPVTVDRVVTVTAGADDSHALRRAIIPMKSVLLVETHRIGGHGAYILPYAKYFLNLGYSVDIITPLIHAEQKFYCEYNFDNGKIRAFFLDFNNSDTFRLMFEIALNYDLIVNATEHNNHCKYTFTCFDHWYDNYVTHYRRNNMFFISHDKDFVERILESDMSDEKKEYMREHCLFTFDKVGADVPSVLWPLDYSLMKPSKEHKKNAITVFLSVGQLISTVKDYNLLFNTMRKLIESGITSFCVKIVSLVTIMDGLDISGLDKHLQIITRCNNERMLHEINECDFILALLTPGKQDRYKKENISGVYYLGVGFSRPHVIEKSFAECRYFDGSNAVIYSGTDMFDAMKRAIGMEQPEFEKMCDGVSKVKDTFIEEGNACAMRILSIVNGV